MASAAKTKHPTREALKKRAQRARTQQPVEPTDERKRHGKVECLETMTAGVAQWQDRWVRQIDRLNEQGKITDRMRDAGERLYQHFLASNIKSASTGAYDGAGGGSKARKHGKRPTEPTPATEPFAAYVRALEVLPAQIATVVRSVVIDDVTPTQATSDVPSKGLERLQEGLNRLADHYGFERDKI
jgi:hypothetical protein